MLPPNQPIDLDREMLFAQNLNNVLTWLNILVDEQIASDTMKQSERDHIDRATLLAETRRTNELLEKLLEKFK